jgi:hypothetical protein
LYARARPHTIGWFFAVTTTRKDACHTRKGVPHLKVSGKGGKTRYLPLHPGTSALIHDYLAVAGHGTDEKHYNGLTR